MAKVELEPMDGRSKLTPGKGMTVAVEDAEPAKRRGNRPVAKTISEITEEEANASMAKLGSTDAKSAEQSPIRERLEAARDRILRIKANRPYWERLEYAQRQQLNGALRMAQETLGDTDDAGLPLTLSQFLGVQLPR